MDQERQFDFKPGVASQATISLSQTILAPLDAIFKAQVHAARSFLSLLLQIGFPYIPLPKKNADQSESDQREAPGLPESEEPRFLEFVHEVMVDGKPVRKKVTMPALALVPLAPLAIETGEVALDLHVKAVERHRQMQKDLEDQLKSTEGETARHERPWFLVDNPISVRGTLAPPDPADKTAAPSEQAKINIRLKVGKTPMPAGLDKLLTSLTQMGKIADISKNPSE